MIEYLKLDEHNLFLALDRLQEISPNCQSAKIIVNSFRLYKIASKAIEGVPGLIVEQEEGNIYHWSVGVYKIHPYKPDILVFTDKP